MIYFHATYDFFIRHAGCRYSLTKRHGVFTMLPFGITEDDVEDHRLKSYCLVVETKSFSRAAQAKHMTQSAMSRLIKNLEEELGVMLLNRKGKAVLPTVEGKLFYEHAQKILTEYSLMKQSIGLSAQASKSVLRLGASRTPAVRLLPQVIYEFSKAHPDIRIDLSVCKTSSIFRDIRDSRIDLGIVEGALLDQNISAETIAEDEVVIIASENHYLTKKKNITPQELFAEQFVLPEPGSGTREMVDVFFRDAGLDSRHIKVRMTLGSPELIVQMAQAGLGIAFVSKWSVFTAVKEGTVKLLRVPGKKMKRHIYLVGIKREPMSVSAKAFKEFIKQYKFFVPF
jgi:LysR family transcriptional regulator, transcriptional activator of the cysJI operon